MTANRKWGATGGPWGGGHKPWTLLPHCVQPKEREPPSAEYSRKQRLLSTALGPSPDWPFVLGLGQTSPQPMPSSGHDFSPAGLKYDPRLANQGGLTGWEGPNLIIHHP